MADKKSEYNFGGHKFDTELYLQNLRDNAEGFLSSKTDWTPEQKEEWKHSYINFTNALQEDIKNGSGRFSTDEFGSIIDNKGEFSNTDSDNFYYDNNGKQISGEEYDKLKKKKQGNYKAFAANRQFANYANQIGKGLRDALKAKGDTADSSEGFDYTKNGFDAYWQKKYNPAGTANDMQPYWAKDKDGEYTNRVSETIADLDDYMSKQEMSDDVKAAYQNYRNVLSQYNPTNKNFNLDTWKNNLLLASNRAGLTNWNNGYFNIGSKLVADNSSTSKTFDINNDQDVIDRYQLADQIAAHPEQRDHIIDLARRQYNQESQKYDEEYNAAVKQEQDAKNNKIWETYLANNPYLKDVTKRIGRSGTGTYWSGGRSIKQDKNHVSQTMITAEEQVKGDEDPNYKPHLRTEVKNALVNANWKNADDPLLQTLSGVTTTNGYKLNNLGKWYQYNWDQLMARRDVGAMNGWTAYPDKTGKNEVWRRNDSYRASDGTYFYMFYKNGKIYTYRSKPYDKLKADVIAKGQLGMSMRTREAQQAFNVHQAQKAQVSAQTAKDKGRTAQEQKNMEQTGFTGSDIARLASVGMDLGSIVAAATGPETLGAGTLVSAGLGVGSTLTNFGADIADGENLWNATKSAGTGLAMDALGLIPGAGAASKMGKIGKVLVRYVPRLLAAYGAYEGYENMPYIVNSTKKLLTPGAKMTVDDYRNITQGIGLVTGVVSAGARRSRGQKNASDFQTTKQQNDYLRGGKNWKLDGPGTRRINMDNEVALNFKDKNGKKVTKIFSGEDAEKIRNASSNKEINEVLSNYDLKDLTLDTRKSLRPHFQWIRSESKKWQSPIHRGNVTATRYNIYKNGKGEVYTNATGLQGWLDPIYDKKSNMSVAKKNQAATGTSATGNTQLSMAELRELSSKLKPLREEWAKLKGAASNARKSRALDLQAARKETIKDIRDAYLASAEQNRQSMEALATEYAKLRNLVNNNKLTFELGPSKKQVDIDWNALLKKYGIKYKQGGSIRKFQAGGQPNPYASLLDFGEYSKDAYTANYGGNQVGMQTNGVYGDPYTSQGAGTGKGRIQTDKQYSTFTTDEREKAKSIENQNLYKQYTEALVKSANDYLNTPEAERSIKWNKDNNEFLYWAEQFDNQYKNTSDKARFFSAPGKLNGSWTTSNNDSYNQPAGKQNSVEERIRALRNDQQLARAHDDREKQGKRYFWEQDGVQHWVDAANIDKIDLNKFNINEFSSDVDDAGTYWTNYKITTKSKADPEEDAANKKNLGQNQGLQEPDLIAKWGIPRAMAADATNRAVTDKLKKQPLLLDPQEDHRYIQSDLDAEMDGTAAAAQYYRYAANPITSDGDTQTALGLEAVGKANDAITQGRQTSNQRLRTMAEQAWTQEVANHTSRHNTAMTNRQSIYDTKNANNSLEAAYDNQKFTIWDTLAQEKEYKEKSDYEQLRAKYDQFAQQDINNSIKYGMLGLNYKAYGMTDADAKLWDSVYNTGTETLENIQKDPAKMKQWNRILSITRQMQNDMLAQHYHIPQSPYHTVRTASYSPTITTSATKQKQGGCLNVKKVRAAAKGEKLAAAQLKAQTADADRFYKTTKDTIDRMYDAIDRLTSYSSTKKKRKKKS